VQGDAICSDVSHLAVAPFYTTRTALKRNAIAPEKRAWMVEVLMLREKEIRDIQGYLLERPADRELW